MKNYRMTAIILALIMMLSLAACGSAQASAQGQETAPAGTEAQSAPAEPVAPEVPAELSDTDAQLELICDNMDKMIQPAGELPWFYTVTDLDRDGCLELIAASQHPQDRSTNLKIWEVNGDRTALTECNVEKDEEESFPDIMSDSMDTFHTADDTWNYLFYDNVVISDTEVYTSKSAFSMKDDVISYEAFAVEHTLVENGVRTTTHTDIEGVEITPEQYNASGVQAFEGAERSSVSFEWLTPDEATDITRLTESFMVFTGLKRPPSTSPSPSPRRWMPRKPRHRPRLPRHPLRPLPPSRPRLPYRQRPPLRSRSIWISPRTRPASPARRQAARRCSSPAPTFSTMSPG